MGPIIVTGKRWMDTGRYRLVDNQISELKSLMCFGDFQLKLQVS